MRIIDRYIAWQFLLNVIVLVVILSVFIVTVDVSLNLDRFLGVAERVAHDRGINPGWPGRVWLCTGLIVDLWWPRLLQLTTFLTGVVLVTAMGFTAAQMVRHREVVAMLASGQSLLRAGAPMVAVAAGLSAMQAANQELVLPRIAPLLARDHGDAGRRELGSLRVPLTRDGQGRLFYARHFDADTGRIEGLWVMERNASGRGYREITASRAWWDGSGWVLEGGLAKPVGPPIVTHQETRPIAEPMDHLANPEPTVVKRIETNLDPNHLRARRYAVFGHNLSWSQISQMLRRPELLDAPTRDRLERIRYGRVSLLVSNLLAMVICMPFFLTRVPGQMLTRSLRCAPVALAALLGGILGTSAPVPGLPPQLSVFLPVLVQAPIAVAVVSSVRT